MPLNDQSFANFYQGSCAEFHVASLFYFAGYEASKISPDAGIDFVVTNVARSRFSGEVVKTTHVQVKSTLHDNTGAAFYLENDELEFLCSGDRFTVFVLFHDFELKLDHDIFDIYADQVQKIIDQDGNNYLENLMAEEGRRRKSRGLESLFDFSHSKLTPFWLNSEQMQRAKDEGFWKSDKDGKGFFLNIRIEGSSILIDDCPLVPALLEIRYIMRNCASSSHFNSGKFSTFHI